MPLLRQRKVSSKNHIASGIPVCYRAHFCPTFALILFSLDYSHSKFMLAQVGQNIIEDSWSSQSSLTTFQSTGVYSCPFRGDSLRGYHLYISVLDNESIFKRNEQDWTTSVEQNMVESIKWLHKRTITHQLVNHTSSPTSPSNLPTTHLLHLMLEEDNWSVVEA